MRRMRSRMTACKSLVPFFFRSLHGSSLVKVEEAEANGGDGTLQYRSGGVSIVGGNGKIDINNTFDERLKLLEVDALPMVRTSLFGTNDNRRFFD